MTNFDHQGREHISSRVWRIMNSAISFTVVFLLFTYLFYLFTALAGKVFGFDSSLTYNGVKFNLHQIFWTRKTVLAICGMGPLVVFVLGLFCAYVYSEIKQKPLLVNLMLMWGVVIGTGMALSHIFSGVFGINDINSPFYQNFAAIYAFFSVPKALAVAAAIGAFFLLVFFAFNFAKPFMSFSFSYRKVNKLNRKLKFFLEIAIVPYILGSAFVSFMTFPFNIYQNTLNLLTIGVGLIMTLYSLNYVNVTMDDVNRYKLLQKMNVPGLVFFMAVFIFIYIMKRGVNI